MDQLARTGEKFLPRTLAPKFFLGLDAQGSQLRIKIKRGLRGHPQLCHFSPGDKRRMPWFPLAARPEMKIPVSMFWPNHYFCLIF